MISATYGAVSIGHRAPFPSRTSIQWSRDGQALVLTRNALYILTPNLGIGFDTNSAVPAKPPGPLGKNAEPVIKWFRTVVELDAALKYNWPEMSSSEAIMTPGSLTVVWREAVWSPSNLSNMGGCLVTSLNSNHEVTLWAASKNPLKGEFARVQDITQLIIAASNNEIVDREGLSDLAAARTIFSQANCISWSETTPIGGISGTMDFSLLAIGNRGGRVIFMSCARETYCRFVGCVHVSNTVVTHIAWTKWIDAGGGKSRAVLATSDADGRISLVRINCREHGDDRPSGRYPYVEFVREDSSGPPFIDRRAVTAMKWINLKDNTDVLVYSKPGTIHLWHLDDPKNTDRNTTIRLVSPSLSIGSSSLVAVSGLEYYARHDRLVLTLADGSFHVITDVSTWPVPTASSQSEDQGTQVTMTTYGLSRAVRDVFVAIESLNGRVTRKDVMNLGSSVAFGKLGGWIWLHEATRPQELRHKTDAQHISMIILQQIWPADYEEVYTQIENIMTHPGNSCEQSPLHLLSGAMLYLRIPATVNALGERLLNLLGPSDADNESMIGQNAGAAEPVVNALSLQEARSLFRGRLQNKLYCSEALVRTRLKLVLARFCMKASQSLNPALSQAYEQLVAVHEKNIICSSLLIVISTLFSFSSQVAESILQVKNSVARFAAISTLISSPPPSLLRVTGELLVALKLTNPTAGGPPLPKMIDIPPLTGSVDLGHKCPACKSTILLGHLSVAVCSRGHSWERCSATYAIIDVPAERTCVSCCRRTLLPSSVDEVEDWVLEEVLVASSFCLCGNRYARMA